MSVPYLVVSILCLFRCMSVDIMRAQEKKNPQPWFSLAIALAWPVTIPLAALGLLVYGIRALRKDHS